MTMHSLPDPALIRVVEPEGRAVGGIIVPGMAQQKPVKMTVPSLESSGEVIDENIWRLIAAARAVPSPEEGANTTYVEINLDGKVQIYEMTEARMLLKANVEARSKFLMTPKNIYQARDYVKANTYQFEMFETLVEAETWAEGYCGFRAGEVRAKLRRYQMRRANYYATTEPAA